MAEKEQVDKRRVTMVNFVVRPPTEAGGEPTIERQEAVDYVRPDFLDAYVAHAQQNWQHVEVSEEPDAGPGGYHGATFVPGYLNHPLAGQLFEATGDESSK